MSMSSSMHYLACSKEDDVINAFLGMMVRFMAEAVVHFVPQLPL